MPLRAVCTTITKSFLSHARVLAASVLEHNPDVRVIVLLADRVDGCFDPSAEPFEMISLDDLGAREAVHRMCFYYSAFELSCALRGLLHRYMQERTTARSWLQLDSDMMVWGDLTPVFEAAERAAVTLTPHLLAPNQADYRDQPETMTTRFGCFNAGFVGVSRDEGRAFIEWFVERLELFCFEDSFGGFVDQQWLTLVPVFFPGTTILDHPGVNIAYWNLFERRLTTGGNGRFLANGVPVLITHYSGFELDRPDQLSKRVPANGNVPPVWREMADRYAASLRRHRYEDARQFTYAFDRFDDGVRITPLMRRMYYEAVRNGTAGVQSPFGRSAWFRAHRYRAVLAGALRVLRSHHVAKISDRLVRIIASRRGHDEP